VTGRALNIRLVEFMVLGWWVSVERVYLYRSKRHTGRGGGEWREEVNPFEKTV
jgi:hypothetical protein